VVTQDQLAGWRRYQELQRGDKRAERPLRAEVEEIVVLAVLDARFEALSPAAKAAHAIRWHQFMLGLAEERLRYAVRKDGAPSEEEVRREFEANPSAYGLPRYWQLENILKRIPKGAGEEDRARARTAMDKLRERILAGADFAQLAKEESDSETRLRGGSAGVVSLAQLAPEVARVVAGMKEGDLSPVIELPDGLTLLRCTRVLEPEAPSMERAHRMFGARVGEERFETAWEDLRSTLQADLQADYPNVDLRQGKPSDVLATYADGPRRGEITREDFQLHLSAFGVDLPTASAEDLRQQLQQRVLREGVLREAERRALIGGKDDAVLLEWKAREMRAWAVESVEVGVSPPAEEELQAAYEVASKKFRAQARITLRALKLPLRRDQPRSIYDEARTIGDRLAAGQMRFDDAATALRPHAERIDLGTLTENEVWGMGLNVEKAVAATPPGGTTHLVQEGRTLWILQVVAKEPGHQLSFAEARDRLRGLLLQKARRRAVVAYRQRIVDEQAVTLAP
jgi:parvulin-like peptidyl-prolyl isomerase